MARVHEWVKKQKRLFLEGIYALLKRWNFDVVAHGLSLHDENSYYVIRRFDSLAQCEQMEDAYYASDDWRQGPRAAMLALIESYTDIVLEVDEVAVQGCVRRIEVWIYTAWTGTDVRFEMRVHAGGRHNATMAGYFICNLRLPRSICS